MVTKISMNKPKVAFVYDRVNTPHGGAEQVLLALHSLYPEAPLFTALYDPKQATWAEVFPKVIPSFLNRLPFLNKLHRWIPFLMPLAFESFDFHEYDIIISITSAEAKGVLTLPYQLHLCYLLTPPRYLYQDKNHSLESHWIFTIPGVKTLAELFVRYLIWWDQQAIFRPDFLIPISQRVTQRIGEYYPQVSSLPVIYPPVLLEKQQKENTDVELPESFFLIVSRLVSYKHIDRAITACINQHKNLIIVGSGPEKKRLEKQTLELFKNSQSTSPKSAITFLSNLEPEKLHTLYSQCDAVLMPGEEDFGIVALEANSYSKPVIIQVKSGAAECIDHRIHGIHITGETIHDIEKALLLFEKTSFSPTQLVHNSQKYGTNRFIERFASIVEKLWIEKQKVHL